MSSIAPPPTHGPVRSTVPSGSLGIGRELNSVSGTTGLPGLMKATPPSTVRLSAGVCCACSVSVSAATDTPRTRSRFMPAISVRDRADRRSDEMLLVRAGPRDELLCPAVVHFGEVHVALLIDAHAVRVPHRTGPLSLAAPGIQISPVHVVLHDLRRGVVRHPQMLVG